MNEIFNPYDINIKPNYESIILPSIFGNIIQKSMLKEDEEKENKKN